MKIGTQTLYALTMVLTLMASAVKGQDGNETEAPTEDDTMLDGNMTIPPDEEEVPEASFPTQAPTDPTLPPTGEGGCYYDLNAVYQLISNDDILFQQKQFVICPGSVMNIGFLIPGVGIDQGQTPIIPRSNTEFLCGEDGKSENNCVLKGGDFGLIAVPVFFRQDLSVNNVLIKGFTFEGQVQYAGFFASGGDITYEDCIFRDSANFGPLVYNFDASVDMPRYLKELGDDYDPFVAMADYIARYRESNLPKRRLLSAEAGAEENEDLVPTTERGLQEPVFEGTLRDCLFTNLQQVERKLGVEFGIISIKSSDNHITLEDCTFAENKYGNQELTPIGYGILVQGGQLTMNGVCFVDNDFRGNGAVLLEQTENPFTADADFFTGNYASEDDNLDCLFAAWFATDEDRRNSNFTCVPAQTDECGGEPIEAPVLPPSTEPDGGEEEVSGGTGHFSNFLLAGLSTIAAIALWQ